MKAYVSNSMFLSFLTLTILALIVNGQEYCYKDVVNACSPTTAKGSTLLPHCNAQYGAIARIEPYLQTFANTHISRSFEYLLMSTHFANYEKNRAGFEKLFRDLSDNKWHEAIELIQYIAKRGGKMDFNQRRPDDLTTTRNEQSYELYEIQSLAKALDMEKQLALQAFEIHDQAARRRKEDHDPEIVSHIENEFVHKQRDIVRKLTGYTTDLSLILREPDSSLALFLFDEYLQKQ